MKTMKTSCVLILMCAALVSAVRGQGLEYSEDFDEASGRLEGRLLGSLDERGEILVWGVNGGGVEVKHGSLNLAESSSYSKAFLKIDYAEVFGAEGFTVSFDWQFNPKKAATQSTKFYAGFGDEAQFQDHRLALGFCIPAGGISAKQVRVVAGEMDSKNQGQPSQFSTAETEVMKKAKSGILSLSFAIHYSKRTKLVQYYVDGKLIGSGEYHGAVHGLWLKADHVDAEKAGAMKFDNLRISQGDAGFPSKGATSSTRSVLKIGGMQLSF